jgi:TIR domain
VAGQSEKGGDNGAPAPCMFLSHSGADTEAARKLKRRILESPQAREAGLTIWFDKDDLAAGGDWQEQIEVAITRKATAFAVYVGSKGVMNWVEREVRLGPARGTDADAIPFVPALVDSPRKHKGPATLCPPSGTDLRGLSPLPNHLLQ